MTAHVNVPSPGSAGNWGKNQLIALGTEYTDPDGEQWVYASVSTNIATAHSAVSVNSSFVAAALTKALADAGNMVGTVMEAVDGSSDTQYGWVRLTPSSVLTGAACAPGPLYTSGTAGVVDDATTGQTRLVGLNATATGTGTGAASACVVQDTIQV